QELPILHLRIRKAARRGARVFEITPRRPRLSDVSEWLLCRPGDEANVPEWIRETGDEGKLAGLRAALAESGQDAVVLAGPRLLGVPGAVEALGGLAAGNGGRFALLCRRANDRGALR